MASPLCREGSCGGIMLVGGYAENYSISRHIASWWGMCGIVLGQGILIRNPAT